MHYCIKQITNKELNANATGYHILLHCVPKKTCDHIFNDNLKQNCPFTKIFGTLITNSISHQQLFLVFHLTYFVQLLYLGKLSRPIYHEFSLKLLIFSMLHNCIIVTILFCLLIIKLTVYNRTITRFIAGDNVVYQWVRWEIRLASDNSWARHHLKHVSWRSR